MADNARLQTAARLRAARAFADLTRADLAARLEMSQASLARREAGTAAPRQHELVAIADATGVPVSFLVDGFGVETSGEILERLALVEALVRSDIREMRAAVMKIAPTSARAGLPRPRRPRTSGAVAP